MSRPLRLEFAGALYHVTSRGDRQEDIYDDDADRRLFIETLGHVCESYNWDCHAYCLMSNHYHLMIETPDANLSKGMRHLNGVYTQSYNRRHRRVGHVFQGRYKAIHVEKESYLLELARYIVLNPVRAEMVRTAHEWPWSSYRATSGQISAFSWLNAHWLLTAFGATKSVGVAGYTRFVAQGKGQPSPLRELKNQVFLGSDDFIQKLDALIDGDKDLSEVPNIQRRGKPKKLKEYESMGGSNKLAMVLAFESGGYTMKEIADYFSVHYSTVSRAISNARCKT
ncbi:MAG: REP element-mobilizing transposase RayT [Arenicella sp.]|jgi:REP element-mobilizing transposase RayT